MSRDKRDEFFGDAVYEAWRSGRDSDRITRDCTDDCYYEGRSPEQCVQGFYGPIERRAREARELEQQQEEEYYRAMEEQHRQSQQEAEEQQPRAQDGREG